jgi:subtilase family serine protease
VIVTAKNQGGSGAGSVSLRLEIEDDDAMNRSISSIEAGASATVAFEVQLKKGDHKLTATVDRSDSVDESDDDNNRKTITVSCRDE